MMSPSAAPNQLRSQIPRIAYDLLCSGCTYSFAPSDASSSNLNETLSIIPPTTLQRVNQQCSPR